MNVNIFGFGSIGKRHLKHLLRFQFIKEIKIFTRKSVDLSNYDSRVTSIFFKDLEFHKSFLTIIATPANTHIEFIKLCYNFSDFILVEKPLTDYKEYPNLSKLDPKQKIFVGYNLRFLDIIQHLKLIINNLIKSNTSFSLNVLNTSHIETWRDQSVKESISLNPNKGGGALLELSHDIDLVDFLLGIDKEKIIINKIKQPLNINNIDSSYNCSGISMQNIPYSIFSSLSSHINKKSYVIDSINFSYEADLINNILKKFYHGSICEELRFCDSRDETFYKQIKQIIDSSENKLLCSFNNGLNIQDILVDSKWL